MSKTLMKSAAVGVALATAAVAMTPATASAQSYYGYDRYDRGYDNNYRNCNYDSRGAGAVVGGAIGAVAGSQLAARGRRTEGSILGGVLGAVVGAGVQADNRRYSRDYCDNRYYSNSYRYDDGYGRYDNRYDDRYYDNRYYDNRSYDRGYYDRYSSGYSYGYGYDQRCRTVSSSHRDWSGRIVTTYREVC